MSSAWSLPVERKEALSQNSLLIFQLQFDNSNGFSEQGFSRLCSAVFPVVAEALRFASGGSQVRSFCASVVDRRLGLLPQTRFDIGAHDAPGYGTR